MHSLVLATRGSALAMAQAESVKTMLEAGGEVSVDLLPVTTKGDQDRRSELVKIGGNGLFVRGIEEELLAGRADIAVHCGKDLPFETAKELVIAGIPKAASGLDCLVAQKGSLLPGRQDQGENPAEEAGTGLVIGTGSMRRIHELRKLYPGAVFRSVRGNITTRIRKLGEGFDGIVLAAAGLERLGLYDPGMRGRDDEMQEGGTFTMDGREYGVRVFAPDECLPACTQGILAIECRRDDPERVRLLRSISDENAWKRFHAERCLFRMLHADCTMPVGIWSRLLDGDRIYMRAMYNGKYAEGESGYGAYEDLCSDLCAGIL